MRFPSDSPASQARLARAIEKERAARMPKTTRGTPFEEHLRAIGHLAAKPVVRYYADEAYDYHPKIGEVAEFSDDDGVTWNKRRLDGYSIEDGPEGYYVTGDEGWSCCRQLPATPPQDPRAQEQAALVAELKAGDLVMVWHIDKWLSATFLKFGSEPGVIGADARSGTTGIIGGWNRWRLPTPAERAQSGGWIEWSGGDDCPVPGGTRIEVRLRNGEEVLVKAPAASWRHAYGSVDIIAYRLIRP